MTHQSQRNPEGFPQISHDFCPASAIPCLSTHERTSGSSVAPEANTGEPAPAPAPKEDVAGLPKTSCSIGPQAEAPTVPQRKTTAAKTFKCDVDPNCLWEFDRLAYLIRHRRKHTGKKHYQCHCKRFYSRFDNCIAHIATHRESQYTKVNVETAIRLTKVDLAVRFEDEIRGKTGLRAEKFQRQDHLADPAADPQVGTSALHTAAVSSNVVSTNPVPIGSSPDQTLTPPTEEKVYKCHCQQSFSRFAGWIAHVVSHSEPQYVRLNVLAAVSLTKVHEAIKFGDNIEAKAVRAEQLHKRYLVLGSGFQPGSTLHATASSSKLPDNKPDLTGLNPVHTRIASQVPLFDERVLANSIPNPHIGLPGTSSWSGQDRTFLHPYNHHTPIRPVLPPIDPTLTLPPILPALNHPVPRPILPLIPSALHRPNPALYRTNPPVYRSDPALHSIGFKFTSGTKILYQSQRAHSQSPGPALDEASALFSTVLSEGRALSHDTRASPHIPQNIPTFRSSPEDRKILTWTSESSSLDTLQPIPTRQSNPNSNFWPRPSSALPKPPSHPAPGNQELLLVHPYHLIMRHSADPTSVYTPYSLPGSLHSYNQSRCAERALSLGTQPFQSTSARFLPTHLSDENTTPLELYHPVHAVSRQEIFSDVDSNWQPRRRPGSMPEFTDDFLHRRS